MAHSGFSNEGSLPEITFSDVYISLIQCALIYTARDVEKHNWFNFESLGYEDSSNTTIKRAISQKSICGLFTESYE